MLGDQEEKKVTQYTRAWYITSGMFKKTSGQLSMDGWILSEQWHKQYFAT